MDDHITPAQTMILQKALTCGAAELFSLLQETDTDIIRAALKNPACSENHLLALLKRRDLREEQLKAVCNHPIAAESHALKISLAQHPATPAPQLTVLLSHLHLFDLVTMCQLPGVTADAKMAAERVIIQRLPGTPLGNKMTLARRATALVLDNLVKDGDQRIIAVCLDNPHLKESSLYQLAKNKATSPETISLIARHPRWQGRPNLKQAILGNPRTPTVWFTLFLPTLTTSELKRLATTSLTVQQKKEVHHELKRRAI